MEMTKWMVELYNEEKGDYEKYAQADVRSKIDRVETIEAYSADGGIVLPPGYIIDSVTLVDDHLTPSEGIVLLVRGCIYRPDEKSLQVRAQYPDKKA